MAQVVIQGEFDVANVDDVPNSHYLSVQEQFETLPGNKHPFISSIKAGPAVTLNESMQIQVIRNKSFPLTITLTAALADGTGTTITASATDIQILQEGQTLIIDDEVVRVTATGTGTTTTISRGFGGSTGAAHANGTVVQIASPLYDDDNVFVLSPFYRGEMASFNMFRTQYAWQQTSTSTAVRSYLTKGKNDLDYEWADKAHRAMSQLEYLALYGKSQQMAAGQPGSPDGIYRLITSNVNNVGGLLSATEIVDTLEMVAAWDEGRTKFTLLGNQNSKRLIDGVLREHFTVQGTPETTSVGVTIDSFRTSHGTIDFMTDRMIRDGELYILDMNDIKLHPLAITDGTGQGWVEFTRGPAEMDYRATKKVYEYQGVLVMGDERRHALIKGFTTTGSSYGNYV
ncbi:MAG: DUF5309 domain-containing protein [Actinomycetota bacterium]|nr:DUF5309 domain-containing protein [Actinomycetota bacterium]